MSGPNLSVTGSLATILWLTAIRREGENVSAWQFLRLGALVMPAALLAGAGGPMAGPGGLNDATKARRASVDAMQRRSLVRGDVVGPVAPDLVLRVVGARAVRVSLVIEVAGVDLDHVAADVSGFGVPADVVADLESLPGRGRTHRRAEAVADDNTACARRQTSSTVKPNSRRLTSPGAEAPKWSMPRTSPLSPT